ncbi:hypothetical protein AB0K05_13045 [Nonomuraea sp. NPDC049486]|uniref:hypothetical protein n=1 Tax=Nonomuraea sp. NPDC049486 TaxID=3155773 RepID=UPI00343CBF79
MAGRKLTDNELTVLLDSLTENQKRHMLSYLCGYNEEAFHRAIKNMPGGRS